MSLHERTIVAEITQELAFFRRTKAVSCQGWPDDKSVQHQLSAANPTFSAPAAALPRCNKKAVKNHGKFIPPPSAAARPRTRAGSGRA
ncbi:MAG: hypothetical protein M9945_22460 [Aquamicrobium sp.]|uniref:hypothetical protein n=1 Tax=Aquamicrobium sp. TaxID=1872579 RepID=UPI00349EF6E4|nr:hypothetical protein [Aquamicrobium sp.]